MKGLVNYYSKTTCTSLSTQKITIYTREHMLAHILKISGTDLYHRILIKKILLSNLPLTYKNNMIAAVRWGCYDNLAFIKEFENKKNSAVINITNLSSFFCSDEPGIEGLKNNGAIAMLSKLFLYKKYYLIALSQKNQKLAPGVSLHNYTGQPCPDGAIGFFNKNQNINSISNWYAFDNKEPRCIRNMPQFPKRQFSIIYYHSENQDQIENYIMNLKAEALLYPPGHMRYETMDFLEDSLDFVKNNSYSLEDMSSFFERLDIFAKNRWPAPPIFIHKNKIVDPNLIQDTETKQAVELVLQGLSDTHKLVKPTSIHLSVKFNSFVETVIGTKQGFKKASTNQLHTTCKEVAKNKFVTPLLQPYIKLANTHFGIILQAHANPINVLTKTI